jgi:hypothetical protein
MSVDSQRCVFLDGGTFVLAYMYAVGDFDFAVCVLYGSILVLEGISV